MADAPDIETVEEGDEYYHVRFRNPDRFEEIRIPDWAANAARSVSESSEVRTGQESEGDADDEEWMVQSVLIDKHASEDTARDQACEIVETIES